MSNCEDIRLFCNGYYAEIMVMDPFSLEVIFCLNSKVNPDWISALHVISLFELSFIPENQIKFPLLGTPSIKAQG